MLMVYTTHLYPCIHGRFGDGLLLLYQHYTQEYAKVNELWKIYWSQNVSHCFISCFPFDPNN